MRKRRSRNGASLAEKLQEAEASIAPDENGCLVWPWTLTRGYGHMWNSETKKLIYVHRAAWQVHRGPIPGGFLVLHKPVICHNPACFNVEHLYLGTDKDNRADRAADGTDAKSELGKFGEAHNNSKLTDDERREICRLCATGEFTFAALGRRFGVCGGTISYAVKSGRWV